MARTPAKTSRGERSQPSPYARPAGQVESQSNQSNQSSGLRRSTSLASSLFSGLGGLRDMLASSSRRPAPVLPTTNRDLGNSESGSEDEEWNGEPPQLRIAPAPASPEDVVADIRRSGHPATVMQLARSLSGGSPDKAASAGPSKRQQAKDALRLRSAQFDPSRPDLGLADSVPFSPSPVMPASFPTHQDLSSLGKTADNAVASSSANGSSSLPAQSSATSQSPFSRFANRISRIISPPSADNNLDTPSKKRSRDTAVPAQSSSFSGFGSNPNAGSRAIQQTPTATSSFGTGSFGATAFRPVAQVTPAAQVAPSRTQDRHAASQALDAYLANKPPSGWTAEDFHVISLLSARAEREGVPQETSALTSTPFGSRTTVTTATPAGLASRQQGLGTWAASTFDGTPRLIRPLPSSQNTPGSVFAAPASPAFSVGTPGSGFGTPRGNKVYLAPGMSARRLNASTSRSALSQSIAVSGSSSTDNNGDENVAKRSRFGSPSSSGAPSPRAGTSTATPSGRAAAQARASKSVWATMRDLVDEVDPRDGETLIVNPYDRPVPAAPASQASSSRTAPGTSGIRATATPAKSALRKGKAAAQAEGTPARGAAARIEQTPSTSNLTTLDLVQGNTPWDRGEGVASRKGTEPMSGQGTGERTASGRHVRIETPERERDDNEVDDLIGDGGAETPSKTTGNQQQGAMFSFGGNSHSTGSAFGNATNGRASGFGSTSTPAQASAPVSTSRTNSPAEVPKKTEPLPAPKLSGLTSFGASVKPSVAPESAKETPFQFGGFPGSTRASSGPAFKPTPVKAPAQPVAEPPTFSFTSGATASAVATTKSAEGKPTAKDLASKVDEAALPFFTYTITASIQGATPSDKVKAKAEKAPLATFSFNANAPPAQTAPAIVFTGPTPTSSVAASSSGFNFAAAGFKAPAQASGQWECGTCMLKNPDSAQKCTICEADRPAPKAAATAAPSTPAFGGFNFAAAGMKPPAKPASQWQCGTCMLHNDDSAQKCTVCEADRPAGKPAATPAPATATTTATGGFNWAAAGVAAPKKEAGWTCSVCMVNNKEGQVKCVACETPK